MPWLLLSSREETTLTVSDSEVPHPNVLFKTETIIRPRWLTKAHRYLWPRELLPSIWDTSEGSSQHRAPHRTFDATESQLNFSSAQCCFLHSLPDVTPRKPPINFQNLLFLCFFLMKSNLRHQHSEH